MSFRPTVRLKLTLAYGGLFLLAGAILLALNYALVSRSVGPVTTAGFTFVAPAPTPGVAVPPFAQGPIKVIITDGGAGGVASGGVSVGGTAVPAFRAPALRW